MDLISRQAAIAHAISGRTRELEGEKWIRVSEVRESLQTMPSAERSLWFRIGEVCVDESKGFISAGRAVEKIRELLRGAEMGGEE